MRAIYFGTQGCVGHYAVPIVGDFSREEIKAVESIDSDNFDTVFNKNEFKMAKFLNYTIFGFPASPDDSRGGSKTVVMIEGRAGISDFKLLIDNNTFLSRQFSRLADRFKVNLY